MAISSGTRFNHYTILSLLGAGAMGEVYLAEDTRLGRRVALKLLPANFVRDQHRLRRFMQEARAASALNHPNILTIFEISQTDAAHFIVAEFVEGVTLRQRLHQGRPELTAALEIAIQVTSALAAAHRAGIVHRDIKPENIMVRPDGLIKVLDFGLAKLVESTVASSNTEAPTMTEALTTDPGTVMGTAKYMSPEQARGLAVDARSDIWSVGCVLYELVAGRAPFEGATRSDILAAVLKEDPPPLDLHAPGVPLQMRRIVKKALAKDVDERYQDVRDMRLDLKSLSRELEPEPGGQIPCAKDNHSSGATAGGSGGRTVEPAGAPSHSSVSSVEYIVGQAQRHKAPAILLFCILVAALAYGGLAVRRLFSESRAEQRLNTSKVRRLTSNGRVRHAAISPDGKYVAFVNEEGGRQGLMIRHVETESSGVLIPPAEVLYVGLSFSRDGGNIYYVVNSRNDPRGALYVTTAPLPGPARKLISHVSSTASPSPDGARLTFVRHDLSREESSLIIADAGGGHERQLAVRGASDVFGLGGPAWSPDGSLISCPVIRRTGRHRVDLVGFLVADGSEKLIAVNWANLGGQAWLVDGSGLIVVGRSRADGQAGGALSADDPQDQDQLWHISYPDGRAQRVTNELNKYYEVSISTKTGQIVGLQAINTTNLWLVPAVGAETKSAGKLVSGRGGQVRQLTKGLFKYDGVDGLSFTPDGRIVYVSYESGNRDIWSIGADGSHQAHLTSHELTDRSPAVSPDGRYIVYVSNRAGRRNLWRMNSDGSEASQLAGTELAVDPCVAPDNRSIVYTASQSDRRAPVLWKISTEGGSPVQLTDQRAAFPDISPDGKLIAFYQWDNPDAPPSLAVIPFGGGPPIKTFRAPVSLTPLKSPVVRWSHDGRMIAYIETREGVSNVWGQPFDGGAPIQLTEFESDEIYQFDWSDDGTQLVVSRGNEISDVVLIQLSTLERH